ncbi:MAG: hypothetical protein ACI9WO_000529 [Sphingobacteriales bacterium]|jgi:hypothetical protein
MRITRLFLTFLLFLSANNLMAQETGGISNQKGEKLLIELEELSKKKTPLGRLVNEMVVFRKPKAQSSLQKQGYTENIWAPHEGKVVRSIKIVGLDVFGLKTVKATNPYKKTFFKIGDGLHVKTQRVVIRNMILFKNGDVLDPLAIGESERLLRSAAFIYDAKILASETDSFSADSIDITVIVRDRWSIGAALSYNPLNLKGRVKLQELNFLGLGHAITLGAGFQNIPFERQGLEVQYNIPNVTYYNLNGRVAYEDFDGVSKLTFGGGRDFFSPSTEFAGGASFKLLQNNSPFLYTKYPAEELPVKAFIQDYWIGFSPGRGDKVKPKIAIRVVNTKYTQRPDTGHVTYQDNTMYLFGVGVNNRLFYRDAYLYNLGVTEDVSAGNLAAVIMGVRVRELETLPYLGGRYAIANHQRRGGYLFGSLDAGTFYKGNIPVEGVVSADLKLISRLQTINGWGWRTFIGQRYSKRFSSVTNPSFTLNTRREIRGITITPPEGNQKIVWNAESVFFPPFKLAGFTFAFKAYADVAIITPEAISLKDGEVYPAFGIGIRFKNEHLVFRAIQVSLSYFPKGPNPFKLVENDSNVFGFNKLNYSKPGVVSF